MDMGKGRWAYLRNIILDFQSRSVPSANHGHGCNGTSPDEATDLLDLGELGGGCHFSPSSSLCDVLCWMDGGY